MMCCGVAVFRNRKQTLMGAEATLGAHTHRQQALKVRLRVQQQYRAERDQPLLSGKRILCMQICT
jgi:hypothetical protein